MVEGCFVLDFALGVYLLKRMQRCRASGHVDRFTDVMVKDVKNGDCIRADHLLEDVMEARINNTKLSQEDRDDAKRHYAQAGNYTKEELQELFFKYEIVEPFDDLSQ